ncbi:MAG TPA: transcriptional regulator [Candidatus Binatia bacterium]|jgi:DNA-binding winged helix-turn-helix (wHTH) protein|nr:transcriptional regulator [Candidatus Binatia bacterium]
MKSAPELHFRHCRLDPMNQILYRGPRMIPLRQKSFAVLQYLVEHPSQLVTKEELLRAVWPGTCVSDTVLRVCIRELRHALKDQKKVPQFIETAHGRGFRFVAPLSTSPQPVPSPKSQVLKSTWWAVRQSLPNSING